MTAQQQPTIIPFGKREMISTGQFNIMLVADKIIRDGVNDWLSISEIAKFVYGKSFLANNKRVRNYIWQLRRALIERSYLLITEGRPIEHVKICDPTLELDRQLAGPMLQKMRKRSDFSAELFEKAMCLYEHASVVREIQP